MTEILVDPEVVRLTAEQEDLVDDLIDAEYARHREARRRVREPAPDDT